MNNIFDELKEDRTRFAFLPGTDFFLMEMRTIMFELVEIVLAGRPEWDDGMVIQLAGFVCGKVSEDDLTDEVRDTAARIVEVTHLIRGMQVHYFRGREETLASVYSQVFEWFKRLVAEQQLLAVARRLRADEDDTGFRFFYKAAVSAIRLAGVLGNKWPTLTADEASRINLSRNDNEPIDWEFVNGLPKSLRSSVRDGLRARDKVSTTLTTSERAQFRRVFIVAHNLLYPAGETT